MSTLFYELNKSMRNFLLCLCGSVIAALIAILCMSPCHSGLRAKPFHVKLTEVRMWSSRKPSRWKAYGQVNIPGGFEPRLKPFLMGLERKICKGKCGLDVKKFTRSSLNHAILTWNSWEKKSPSLDSLLCHGLSIDTMTKREGYVPTYEERGEVVPFGRYNCWVCWLLSMRRGA